MHFLQNNIENIFLTGASGNLGRNLKKYLPSDVNIHELKRTDWNSDYFIKRMNISKRGNVLIHCAWPVGKQDYQSSAENEVALHSTLKLFEAFKSSSDGGLIVGIGSVLEVGKCEEIFDDSPANPASFYAEAKAMCNQWLKMNNGENFIWARVAYQVSRFDPDFKLIPRLLSKSQDFQLLNPYNFVDFIHVGDVAQSILKLLLNGAKGEILVGTGRTLASKDLALLLNPACNIQYGKADPFIQVTHPKILKSLNWMPTGFSAMELSIELLTEEY